LLGLFHVFLLYSIVSQLIWHSDFSDETESQYFKINDLFVIFNITLNHHRCNQLVLVLTSVCSHRGSIYTPLRMVQLLISKKKQAGDGYRRIICQRSIGE